MCTKSLLTLLPSWFPYQPKPNMTNNLKMYSDFLEEINSKYSAIETELDQKIKLLLRDEERINSTRCRQDQAFAHMQKACPSLEEAKKRNAEIIKSLEMAKARLRSRSTYSPIESILEKALKNYSQTLILAESSALQKEFTPA